MLKMKTVLESLMSANDEKVNGDAAAPLQSVCQHSNTTVRLSAGAEDQRVGVLADEEGAGAGQRSAEVYMIIVYICVCAPVGHVGSSSLQLLLRLDNN